MESFILYIAKVGICLGTFLIIYTLFLRPTTFYRFNRAFLLLGFIISFIIPAIRYSYDVLLPVTTIEKTISKTVYTGIVEHTNLWTSLFILYTLGIAFLFVRNILAYKKLRSLVKNGVRLRIDNIKIIENENIKSPFSILNCVLLNTRNITEIERKLILQHEMMHINQKHWLDLLCGECILLVQWFNPLAWIYVHLLKENHEFLADQAVIDSGVSPTIYKAILINQRLQQPIFSFSNSFKGSKSVSRLNMLHKEKSSHWKRIGALATIPVFGLFIWMSALPNYIIQSKTDSTPNTIKSLIVDSNSDKPQVLVLGAKEKAKIDFKEKSISTNAEEKQPLFIVDGNRKGDIAHLNPDDIESISVFKDEDAMHLYGEDAKNGVLIVTTKKNKFSSALLDSAHTMSSSNIAKSGNNAPIASLPNKNEELGNPLEKALILIDGKQSSAEDMKSLDSDNIESVDVIKGKTSSEYGDQDVIKIKTKNAV